MTYLPNALNTYETYTYNLKMFMIRPEDVSKMEKNISSSGLSELIVDNAGKASYNINNLEQQYVVGHNRVRNTFLNRFTMSIAEANGVTLLDTIRRAAQRLGIVDHKQAVYILVVEFNGRKRDGLPHKHPQVFYYPIKITDFEFKVDAGGTNYNITAIENSINAYGYLSNVIKNQITIEASTVGEFFDLFNAAANQSAQDAIIYSTDQLLPDVFDIIFDDSISGWKDWQFQALAEEKTQGAVNILSAGVGTGQSTLQVTIGNGSNLTDIVSIILSQTAEYKQIVLSGNAAYARKNPNADVSSDLSQLPVFHKIVTDVQYLSYDWLRGDYVKKNSYKVMPYIIADQVLSPQSWSEGITNANIQARRVQALQSNGLLRKRYDYIFTGANTEVLEFDIKINHAYYHVTPYGGGQLGDADITAPHASGDATPAARLLTQLQGNKAEVSRLQSQQRATQSSTNTAQPGPFGAPVAAATQLALGNLTLQINAASTAVTDTARQYEQALQNAGMSPGTIAQHIRYAQDVISDSYTAGSDNDNTGGHLKFGSLVTNIENQADLMSIELGIRGDPYWLGRPNSFYNTGLSGGDNLADFEKGTNGFYLKCSLPYPFEDETGRRKPNVEYEISGFYTVVDVITRYTGGQFTMYLNAIRDLGTNTPTALTALEGTAGYQPVDVGSSIVQAIEDPAETLARFQPSIRPQLR